ncbi:MAG: hypothetical protein ACTSPZ_08870, partial [Promethearchaeota archaeon]
ATYDTKSTFNQKYSYGFIPLWGLQSEIGFQVKNTINSIEKLKKNSQATKLNYEYIRKNNFVKK